MPFFADIAELNAELKTGAGLASISPRRIMPMVFVPAAKSETAALLSPFSPDPNP